MKSAGKDLLAAGIEWLRERDPASDSILEELRGGSSELVDLLVTVLYGNVFARSGLDERTKCLLAVACAAAGGFAPQVRYQTRLALLSGLRINDLYEVCFVVAAFNGLSNAMNAMNLMRAVHEEMGGYDVDEKPQTGAARRQAPDTVGRTHAGDEA